MSRMQRKVNSANGLALYLVRNKVFTSYPSPRKLNKVLVEFLKDNNMEYKEWNKRYKGLNTADLVNAEYIQPIFSKFAKWVSENK